MKHPEREEWIPYLFDEAEPPSRTRLSRHLKDCPDCAGEIAAWKRSLKQLDTWSLPEPESARARVALFPGLGWAVAAAIALGFGVLIGRLHSPAPADAAEMRAQIEDSVRSALQAELQEALDEFQEHVASAVGAAETRLASSSYSENQRAWRALLEIIDAHRAQDSRALQAALRRMESQSSAQYVALRKDLETLASLTDDEIRQARFSLMQLASSTTPTE